MAAANFVEVDVLIVGAGYTGLVLLRNLKNLGYLAIAVTEHEIGHGQSLHNHGYVHRGYTRRDDKSIHTFAPNQTTEPWKNLCKEFDVTMHEGKTYQCIPSASSNDVNALWSKYSMPFCKLKTPEVEELFGKHIASEMENKIDVFRVEDATFCNEKLFHGLANSIKSNVVRGSITNMQLDSTGSKVSSVHIEAPSGPIQIHPRFVILATGPGTSSALKLIQTPQPLELKQVCRSVPMVCIRTNKPNVLPDVDAIVNYSTAPLMYAQHNMTSSGKGYLGYLTSFSSPRITSEPLKGTAECEVNYEQVLPAIEAWTKMFACLHNKEDELEFAVFAGWKLEEPDDLVQFPNITNACVSTGVTLSATLSLATRTTKLVQDSLGKPAEKGREALEQLLKEHESEVKIGEDEFNRCKWMPWKEFSEMCKAKSAK